MPFAAVDFAKAAGSLSLLSWVLGLICAVRFQWWAILPFAVTVFALSWAAGIFYPAEDLEKDHPEAHREVIEFLTGEG